MYKEHSWEFTFRTRGDTNENELETESARQNANTRGLATHCVIANYCVCVALGKRVCDLSDRWLVGYMNKVGGFVDTDTELGRSSGWNGIIFITHNGNVRALRLSGHTICGMLLLSVLHTLFSVFVRASCMCVCVFVFSFNLHRRAFHIVGGLTSADAV